jgi:hypothetical protein
MVLHNLMILTLLALTAPATISLWKGHAMLLKAALSVDHDTNTSGIRPEGCDPPNTVIGGVHDPRLCMKCADDSKAEVNPDSALLT